MPFPDSRSHLHSLACGPFLHLAITSPSCLLLIKTLWLLWALPDNPAQFLHLKILNMIISVKSVCLSVIHRFWGLRCGHLWGAIILSVNEGNHRKLAKRGDILNPPAISLTHPVGLSLLLRNCLILAILPQGLSTRNQSVLA